ncbi:MAG TPA: [LysW]-lysine hydrolase [Anaerolineales bacterium]|nr:[LysW]-lysine hydrolase [Anaerolineales bacterium]
MDATDLSTLVGLVSAYSPSGQERGAAVWLVGRMQALGYASAFVDGAGNAVGIMGEGTRQIVLLGHIDTVRGEIKVRREGVGPHEVLYGRGSVDAKGPLACFVDAVAQVGALDGWRCIVIGAVEEERDSEGARYAADQYKPDFTIIGEPNRWDRIALGYKGSAWASIKVQRAQMHAASAQETACESAVGLWLKIKAYADAFNQDRQRVFDQLLPTLRGMDSESNDFEQWARLRVGVRLPVDLSPENWYAKLNEMMGEAIVETAGFAVSAYECDKHTPLVRAFLSGIRSQGGEPRFVLKTGTSDLNIVAPQWKCPALVYGPGDSNLDHTPAEHLLLEEYRKAVAVLRDSLLSLARMPALAG